MPTLDYDLAMYINTAPPDPAYLTTELHLRPDPDRGERQPGRQHQRVLQRGGVQGPPRRGRRGRRGGPQGADHHGADADGAGLGILPLVTYPKTGVINTDKIGGPVDAEHGELPAVPELPEWEDVDGDGKIVIGAEQWPTCLNPVTECATSSWYLYTISNPLLPAVWDTTNEQGFEITNLVTAEPVGGGALSTPPSALRRNVVTVGPARPAPRMRSPPSTGEEEVTACSGSSSGG